MNTKFFEDKKIDIAFSLKMRILNKSKAIEKRYNDTNKQGVIASYFFKWQRSFRFNILKYHISFYTKNCEY